MRRRQFVAAAATLPAVGIAGCPGEAADGTETPDGRPDPPRAYARWLPASALGGSADAVTYVHEDWSDGPLVEGELPAGVDRLEVFCSPGQLVGVVAPAIDRGGGT